MNVRGALCLVCLFTIFGYSQASPECDSGETIASLRESIEQGGVSEADSTMPGGDSFVIRDSGRLVASIPSMAPDCAATLEVKTDGKVEHKFVTYSLDPGSTNGRLVVDVSIGPFPDGYETRD